VAFWPESQPVAYSILAGYEELASAKPMAGWLVMALIM